ncbi:MAG: hypothetical protein P8183_03735 [Anaerolineae bacterium]|jgi:hypothetical protein
MDLLFVFYAMGPALFGYALAYLLVHPEDWTGPAIVLPLSLVLTVLTQRKGTAWISRKKVFSQFTMRLVRGAGLAMGLILFLLMFFVLLR